jgi:hypothetical protein
MFLSIIWKIRIYQLFCYNTITGLVSPTFVIVLLLSHGGKPIRCETRSKLLSVRIGMSPGTVPTPSLCKHTVSCTPSFTLHFPFMSLFGQIVHRATDKNVNSHAVFISTSLTENCLHMTKFYWHKRKVVYE